MRVVQETRTALAYRRLIKELGLSVNEPEDPLIEDLSIIVARVGKLQDAMQKVIEGDYPRTRAKVFAKDGTPSKHDQCPHSLYF